MIVKHKRRGDRPMIDVISTMQPIDYVKDGAVYQNSCPIAIMVGSEDDLDILTDYTPGSLAFTADLKNLWQLDASGTWQAVLEEE